VILFYLIAWSIAAVVIDAKRAQPVIIIWALVLGFYCLRLCYRKWIAGKPTVLFQRMSERPYANKMLYVLYVVLAMAVIAISIACSWDDLGRLAALGGLAVFIILCVVFSWDRKAIKLRPIVWGFGLQFIFGLLILRTNFGFRAFEWLGDLFSTLLAFTSAGSGFVYGYLALGDPAVGGGFGVFAFSVIPTVIFFGALVSVLYYLGVIQFLIYWISLTMQYTLGTSSSESLNAAGNIFVGMTEAPLLIRPFLPTMTKSELHAVMTGGFSTIAGGVLAIYISFGVPASHLLSASVMSAPAALAISKIVYPENEISPTASKRKEEKQNEDEDDAAEKVLEALGTGDESNVIEAAANGASLAVGLAANIAGMLIAALALIAAINYLLNWWGALVDVELSFEIICGWVMYPVAILMGIQPADALVAGEIIGIKIVINEFVAYGTLVANVAEGSISARSEIILIYALCGFSNLGSIGITLGGLTPLAPKRANDLARLVFSAMLCGNVACFMTACIAALLYDPERA